MPPAGSQPGSPIAGLHVGGVNPARLTGPPHPPGPLTGGHLPPQLGRPVPEAHPPVPGPAPVPGSVPPPGMHAGGPVDGPDPADDAALHDLQRLLATSLSLAGPIDEVAGRLHDALLLARPQVLAVLPGIVETQRDQLAQALTWLVDHLDQPPVLAAGCGQLGGALREFGIQPQQLQLLGAALAEAMRAGMPGGWRQEYDAAWRSTWRHVHEWITHGARAAAYQPVTWTAVVTGHELRRGDLAVLRLRPYLPMPYRPGQYARIEVPELPGVWRPYSLAGVPRRTNEVELHVRAKGEAGVSGALVHRTGVGDRVRLGRAEGAMGLPGTADRDLLFIAGDTGVAPIKAMLAELAVTADPRSAVLFWGARTLDELYDIDEIAALARACRRATVVPVISEGPAGPYASGLVTDAVAAYGEWSSHEVFLAGPPPMLAATRAVLVQLGITPERIHHDPTDAGPPAQRG